MIKNIQLIKNELDYRLRNIQASKHLYINSKGGSAEFAKSAEIYFRDISYLIFYIEQNELLNSYLKANTKNQLEYERKISENRKEVLKLLKIDFNDVSRKKIDFDLFNNLKLKKTDNNEISFTDFFNKIEFFNDEIDTFDISLNLIENLNLIIQYIDSEIPNQESSGIPSFKHGLSTTLYHLNLFEKVTNAGLAYTEEYYSVAYFNQLKAIDSMFNPGTFYRIHFEDQNLFSNLANLKAQLLNKKDNVQIERFTIQAERLVYFLNKSLDLGGNRSYILEKFKIFMELYYQKNIPKSNYEKFFQLEFEKFLFLHDIFPLSEVQIGSGRLDTLSVSNKNAILYELKQIGFNQKDTNQKQILLKTISGFIQASIYQNRLSLLPNLDNNVYIIIFTKILFSFKENLNFIKKNEINFHFIIIDLSNIPPSDQKCIHISIEDLFE